MRKIILFMHISLDGYISGPDGELDWVIMTDEEMDSYLITDLLTNVDTMILGRNLFEGFKSYWPNVSKEPDSKPELVEFANWLEDSPKYVVSTTLETVDWKNSFLIKENIIQEIKNLKNSEGKDIVLFGGTGLASSLAELGLIDEYRLKVEPIVIGKGVALFKGIKEHQKLKLKFSKGFSSGVNAVYYEVENK